MISTEKSGRNTCKLFNFMETERNPKLLCVPVPTYEALQDFSWVQLSLCLPNNIDKKLLHMGHVRDIISPGLVSRKSLRIRRLWFSSQLVVAKIIQNVFNRQTIVSFLHYFEAMDIESHYGSEYIVIRSSFRFSHCSAYLIAPLNSWTLVELLDVTVSGVQDNDNGDQIGTVCGYKLLGELKIADRLIRGSSRLRSRNCNVKWSLDSKLKYKHRQVATKEQKEIC